MKNYYHIFKRKLADYCYKSPVVISNTSKIVSFSFDDVPQSAFENAGEILAKHTINGTFYICLGFLQDDNKEGLYTEKNIKDCVNAGNEIGCHTFSHFHFFNTTDRQFIINDLKKNRETFDKLNLGVTLKNFSFPFGEQTRLAKKCAATAYHSCRGIDHGINSVNTDLNNLKAVKLYEGKHSLIQIDDILADFNRKGGWLIFYTHDVQKDFTQYGCSPAYFESVVKKCIDFGFSIKTIEQALNTIKSGK